MNLINETDTKNMQWTSVIRPRSGWFDIDLKGLWNYRDLIMLFVRRDFVAIYKQTILWPLWFLLQPLFSSFAIQFGLFLIFTAYFYIKGSSINPNLWILLPPVLLVQMAALGLGFGILVSSLTTKYRDLVFVVSFGVQLWMYATPIVYPMSQIPLRWQPLYVLNPMVAVVETSRYAFLGAGTILPWHLILSMCMTIIILSIGIIMFSRIEKTFMDTV